MTQPGRQLDALLSAMVEGRLTSAEEAELQKILLGNEAAQRRYLDHLLLHSTLTWDLAAVGDKASSLAEATSGPAAQPGWPPPLSGWVSVAWNSRSLRLLSAVTMLWWVSLYLFAWMIPPFQAAPLKPPTLVAPATPIAARLTASRDLEWAQPTAAVADNSLLRRGQSLSVAAGLAEIQFLDGTRVVVEGPAELTVNGGNAAHLRRGRLWADVPQQARGFRVQTPSATLTDLGTTFGVDVMNDAQTEVHVFKGLVNVLTFGDVPQEVTLSAGQRCDIKRRGQLLTRGTSQTEKFVRHLPASPETRVGVFTGADPGEGLDLTGEVVTALNLGGPTLDVGPVRFSAVAEDAQVAMSAAQINPAWGDAPLFGDSPADAALAQLMHSVVWVTEGELTLELTTEPGAHYQLQLLFAERQIDPPRGFQFWLGGAKISNDFEPLRVTRRQMPQANPRRLIGVVCTHRFEADADRYLIRLGRGTEAHLDRNPFLQALLLTRLPSDTTVP